MNKFSKTKEQLLTEIIQLKQELAKEKATASYSSSQIQHPDFYKIFIESTSDYICKADLKGNYTYLSPSHINLGYEPQELLGKSGFDYIHPEDAKRLPELLKQGLQNPETALDTIEYRFKTKKGDWRDFHCKINILYDKKGLPESIMIISRDITDTKIYESEINKFRLVLDKSLNGVAIVDLNGEITYINDYFANIHGYNAQELIGKNLSIFHTPKQIKAVSEINKTVYKEGSYGPREVWHVHKDGTEFPMLMSGVMINDSKNKPLFLAASAIDITERKQIVDKLKDSEKYFRAIIENSNDVISVLDSTGAVIYQSPSHQKVLGYNVGELLEQNIFHLIHPDDREAIAREYSQLDKNQERIRDINFKYKHKNGTWIDIEGTAKNLLNVPEVQGVVINFRDVTEKKRLERVNKVILNISNAVITTNRLNDFIDVIKKELSSIIDTTNFYVALYDKKSNAYSLPFNTDNTNKLITIPTEKSLIAYVIKTEKSLLATPNIKKKLLELGDIEQIGTASKIWLGVPLLANGEIIGAFAVQSFSNKNAYNKFDIEMLEIISKQISISIEKKKAEEKLEVALEKAVESERLKSAFLSNMSHEIRTPMNGILGFIKLLNTPNLSNKKQKQFTDIINTSSQRLLGTINNLIDISKIEAKQMKITNTEMSINNLLNELLAFFSPEASLKGISLTSKPVLSENKSIVITDNEKLHGILINLIKNAIKFTKEGSVSFGYYLKDNMLEFYVKDTGIGIPKDRQKAIFNRFEQADIEDTRVYEGSGLGLAIAKAYVKILGGKIWLTSEEKLGSIFMFTIPYKVKEKAEKSPIKTNTSKYKIELQTKDLNIVIAEDEEVSILYLQSILGNIFNKVSYVKNGLEAVKTCKKDKVNIILMDIKMPIMNGYEACKEIREFDKDVIIIAQTAYAFAGDKKKAMEVGCDAYISKPIEKNALISIINTQINKRKDI